MFSSGKNLILAEFRTLWTGQIDILDQAEYLVEWELDGDRESPMTSKFTPGQIIHARKVLERFVRIYKEEGN